MGKSIYFSGQPIFTQLLKFIPLDIVGSLSDEYRADRYCKKFMAYDHLVSMLYASFHQSSSIRELITGLQANSSRLKHLGFKHTPRRSTLSDANGRRPVEFFADLYHWMYKKHFGLPDSRSKKDRLFIIDSTTITLFSSIMHGAGSYKANGKKKGGVKAHTLMDADNNVPAFVHITEGKKHDLTFLSVVNVPKGSTVVLDKAYIKYSQFDKWSKESVRWVTRTKYDAHITELSVKAITKESAKCGVTNDRIIQLGRKSNKSKTKIINVREVEFYDTANKRSFRFISNDFQCPPEEIANIYKRRWEIELLFKRIKQNYPLRYFLGDNPNAIQIQIWTALICDLLVRIVQKAIKTTGGKRWSYANLASMIRHHLMTYIDLIGFLCNPEKALLDYQPPDSGQLEINF